MENYTINSIDLSFVKHFLRIEEFITEDDVEIQLMMETAKSVLVSNTDRAIEDLDTDKSANIVYLALISHFYHNRTATGVSNTKVDPIFDLVLKNLRNESL
ncbi:head-tail connector protein [Priestia megaterium]|uniref:head-tail connector protein n=1 Tax=Priestia megaterium TaxID=1404 RepID=UPI002E1E97E6|nr:head-tail connector protein [Priestia megaterium]MED4278307.1 head-tail connector protein [Priestia megaterium]MED4314412.1 head-tail connector protein [Priestia megaterium]